jgi:predicted transcriptional regulator
VPLALILSLCLFKFLSWAIALGSGTSGGTLAPLLTIGGAAGAIISSVLIGLFPGIGISIPMGALIGMSAMFAGASRAYLTSITFALEATMQSHALLPLLGACTASYLVSFFLMENTIMTEKIARRGVVTPDSYEPDVLQKIRIAQVIKGKSTQLNANRSVWEVREWLTNNPVKENCLAVVNDHLEYQGTVKLADIYAIKNDGNLTIESISQKHHTAIKPGDTLRSAVELMAQQDVELLPVLENNKIIGVLSYSDIVSSYKQNFNDNETAVAHISLKRQRMKMMLKGKNIFKKTAEK